MVAKNFLCKHCGFAARRLAGGVVRAIGISVVATIQRVEKIPHRSITLFVDEGPRPIEF
jgi:hypothetical protein